MKPTSRERIQRWAAKNPVKVDLEASAITAPVKLTNITLTLSEGKKFTNARFPKIILPLMFGLSLNLITLAPALEEDGACSEASTNSLTPLK